MGSKPRRQPAAGMGPRWVADVMRRNFISVRAGEPISSALGTMRLARLRHLVVERDGFLAGVLTYRDLQDRELARLTQTGAPPAQSAVAVEEAMTDAPYVVTPSTSLALAATRMCQFRVGCLPVVTPAPEGELLVGVLTESDLILAAYTPR